MKMQETVSNEIQTGTTTNIATEINWVSSLKFSSVLNIILILSIAYYTIFEPCHEIMALFVLRKLILQTQPSSRATCLIFGRTLRLFPYYVC